KRRRHPS
nr:Chain B, Pimtide [synthetic construct]